MKLNIEELAREADKDGIGWLLDEGLVHPDELERFARRIVERCAQECEQTENGEGPDCWDWHAKDYARAIRNLMED